MSRFNDRLKAQALRRQGISIVVIAKKLSVSKSSVSKWCRTINLTEDQFEKLRKNKGVSLTTGQRMGAETNKKKRLDAILNAELSGKNIINKISKRELLLIVTALYWCEGSKSDRTSGFILVNSDPDMIYIVKYFLVHNLDIPIKDIVCSIQINKIHKERINLVLSFWKNLLKLPKDQFRKPYYVNTKVKRVYENYDNYYGICRLSVRRGMNLKYRMLGLIKAIKDDILPA